MMVRFVTLPKLTVVTSTADVPGAGVMQTRRAEPSARAVESSASAGAQHPIHACQRVSTDCARAATGNKSKATLPTNERLIMVVMVISSEPDGQPGGHAQTGQVDGGKTGVVEAQVRLAPEVLCLRRHGEAGAEAPIGAG